MVSVSCLNYCNITSLSWVSTFLQDVCKIYPCREGKRCIRRGGAACLDANGCDPDDLRLCSKILNMLRIIHYQFCWATTIILIVSFSSIFILIFFTVNPESLVCDNQPVNSASADDNAVCATNGATYSSLCRLIQDTGNEAVAYVGECDREECEGGPVSA